MLTHTFNPGSWKENVDSSIEASLVYRVSFSTTREVIQRKPVSKKQTKTKKSKLLGILPASIICFVSLDIEKATIIIWTYPLEITFWARQ